MTIFPCYTILRYKKLSKTITPEGFWAVTALKCAECSRPSTRKTKLKENKTMKDQNISTMTQAAMISAVYVVLTYVFAPFSFGEVQIRIAEALTILPVFTPAADRKSVV